MPAAHAVRDDGDGEFCIMNKEDGLPPGAPQATAAGRQIMWLMVSLCVF